jgi:molybdopterin-guanine dinucleotide biosynthesis protein A
VRRRAPGQEEVSPCASVGLFWLAGGRSLRFGGEKAIASLNGHTLLACSLRAIAPSCHAIAVNAEAKSGAAEIANNAGYPILSDDPAHPRLLRESPQAFAG